MKRVPKIVQRYVDAMLKEAWTARELHIAVDLAVNWIEAHPAATHYSEKGDT